MLKNIVLFLVMMTLATISAAQHAVAADQQPLTYDRLNFSVSVQEEVANDTVRAVLYALREGSEAGRLADEVNEEIGWAVARAKEEPAIKVETGDYQTFPVYSKQTLTGWRVRQSISLETQDAAALSGLLGQLQPRLAIQSIDHTISPERRQDVEKRLITAALARFTERAQMVTEQLERAEYRIVTLDIDTGADSPMRPIARSSMMLAAEASVTPPTLEAGTNTLTVTVRGTIELQVR
jgi:predicted secreted protein